MNDTKPPESNDEEPPEDGPSRVVVGGDRLAGPDSFLELSGLLEEDVSIEIVANSEWSGEEYLPRLDLTIVLSKGRIGVSLVGEVAGEFAEVVADQYEAAVNQAERDRDSFATDGGTVRVDADGHYHTDAEIHVLDVEAAGFDVDPHTRRVLIRIRSGAGDLSVHLEPADAREILAHLEDAIEFAEATEDD